MPDVSYPIEMVNGAAVVAARPRKSMPETPAGYRRFCWKPSAWLDQERLS
jgi:hypothetical protein